MKIAIIGTGRMGKGLLKTFYPSYATSVLFAGRNQGRAQEVIDELGLNLQAVTMEEALNADLIIPTLWFRDLIPWAKNNETHLKGKIVIDITNPFQREL